MPVILNIEMPSCCNDCPCMYDKMLCKALGIYFDDAEVIDIYEDRLPNCPMTEVRGEGYVKDRNHD